MLRILPLLAVGALAFAAPLLLAQAPPAPEPAAPPAEKPAADPNKPQGLFVDVSPEQIFNEGVTAFQKSEWDKAIVKLESLFQFLPPDANFANIYFMLGASYFNKSEWQKAAANFENYRKKYPKADRITEALFALAQCYLMDGKNEQALKEFQPLENVPALYERVLLFEAVAYNDDNKKEQAMQVLQRLVGKEVHSTWSARGGIMLASLYAEKTPDKAVQMLYHLQGKLPYVENVVQLNSLAVEMGDDFLDRELYKDALGCFRHVRTREEIIAMQNDRIARMQRAIEQKKNEFRANPALYVQSFEQIKAIELAIEEAKTLMADFEKLPDFTPNVLIRMARAYYYLEKKWESIVVYDEILAKYKEERIREPTMFGKLVSLAELHRSKLAQKICMEYLEAFPKSGNAATAGFLMGATAIEAGDLALAETTLAEMLEKQQDSPFREDMRFLCGNAKFMQGKFPEALTEYRRYLQDYPQGSRSDDIHYRIGVTLLADQKYEEAITELEAYLKNFSEGQYIADVKYRLMICNYAARKFQEVIAAGLQWEKDYPENKQLGEILALVGDCYVGMDKRDEALPIYQRAWKKAPTDEVLNYSLMEASKILQKKSQWEKVAEMYNEFLQMKPEHPTGLLALYWIGVSKARLGEIAEAKQFLADTIKRYIDDPRRETVELMLTQLAQLCAKKPRPVKAPPAAAATAATTPGALTPPPGTAAIAQAQAGVSTPEAKPAAPAEKPAEGTTPAAPATPPAAPAATVTAAATPAPFDPEGDLQKLLGPVAEANPTGTAAARVLFAKAELADARRKPEEGKKFYADIATKFKPEVLSPLLLARTGDYLLAIGKLDEAKGFYIELMETFPKSEVVDFAYNGIGEIAFQRKNYPEALKFFDDAIDKIGASWKLKEVTVGRGKVFLALDRLDEAKKVFEQVVAVREWRGETTAFGIYSLGEIEEKQGRLAEANAFYQRVYVAYQRYAPWVAKAYLKSGETFEKLGQKKEAVNTYREMLRNERIAGFAECQQAKKRLQEMGESS